jgi:hypothetical protein
MHGTIISGLDSNPEILRLQLEVDRLRKKTPGFAKSTALRDAEKLLTYRQKMEARKAALFAEAEEIGADALDLLASRIEAQDMAERMQAAGYTDAQIQAIIRPMVVNPSSTITGRKERKAARQKRREERRAAGKGIFRKIGKAIKEGAQKAFSGLAKLNPVLVGARAAFLGVVKKNTFGLADKLAGSDEGKLQRKWKGIGGEWDKLRSAIASGKGQRITGLDDWYDIPSDRTPEMVLGAIPVVAAAASKDGLGKILELAKPVIELILGAVGIKLGGREKAELDAIPTSPEAKTIQEQAEDAADESTGEGAGYNSGSKPFSPILLAAIAAGVLILARKK